MMTRHFFELTGEVLMDLLARKIRQDPLIITVLELSSWIVIQNDAGKINRGIGMINRELNFAY